jgi:predicted dehydrogenase
MKRSRRRDFLKAAGAGAAMVALGADAADTAAARRVRVAVVGTGGMGSHHVRELASRADAEVAFVCDVDQPRLDAAAQAVASASGKAPRTAKDLREVLDDRTIEAVFIATPDHWHAPAAILALDAGKHVYVEKPCSHNIREGRLLVEAARRTGKAVQVGTQTRSTATVWSAIERIQSGAIGDILVAKAWNSQLRSSIGKSQPSDPPASLDFDLWLGPTPAAPYRSNLLPGIWRWWYDYGCGDIGNDGVHDIDVACWGLGVTSHPVQAACLGGKYFFDDDQQFPDTQYAVFDYAPDAARGRRRQLVFEQRTWSPYVQEGYENGVAFYGTGGVLIIGHAEGWKLYGPKNELIAEARGTPDLSAHHANFLDRVRAGSGQLHADAMTGHLAATLVHLANIAARVGRLVRFDPSTEQVIGDPEAGALVRRRYREGHWAVPRGV